MSETGWKRGDIVTARVIDGMRTGVVNHVGDVMVEIVGDPTCMCSMVPPENLSPAPTRFVDGEWVVPEPGKITHDDAIISYDLDKPFSLGWEWQARNTGGSKMTYEEARKAAEDYLMGEVKFWCAYGNRECLYHESVDEAVEEYLDDAAGCDEAPLVLQVFGYAPMIMDKGRLANDVLYYVHAEVDETLGDPHKNSPAPTEKMRRAAEALVDAVFDEYEPWACEIIVTVLVDVREWIENRAPTLPGEVQP